MPHHSLLSSVTAQNNSLTSGATEKFVTSVPSGVTFELSRPTNVLDAVCDSTCWKAELALFRGPLEPPVAPGLIALALPARCSEYRPGGRVFKHSRRSWRPLGGSQTHKNRCLCSPGRYAKRIAYVYPFS